MKAGSAIIDDEGAPVAEELDPTRPPCTSSHRRTGYPVGHADQDGPTSGGHRSRHYDERSAAANVAQFVRHPNPAKNSKIDLKTKIGVLGAAKNGAILG
jgi:hypothetical protein